jgi:hypothetical protein
MTTTKDHVATVYDSQLLCGVAVVDGGIEAFMVSVALFILSFARVLDPGQLCDGCGISRYPRLM